MMRRFKHIFVDLFQNWLRKFTENDFNQSFVTSLDKSCFYIGHLKIQSTSIMQIFIIEKICYNSNIVYEIIKKIHQ